MNKSELVAEITKGADITNKAAEQAFNAFTQAVTTALTSGEKVQLVGFGTFEVKERAARTVAATKVPSFKAGKELKTAVN